MAAPLVLNKLGLESLARLRAYAEANVVSARDMIKIVQRKRKPVGCDPKHVVQLPFGWTVVFSIEDHGPRVVRHLSVSSSRGGGRPTKPPSLGAVALIARELGFSVGADLKFSGDQIVRPDVDLGMVAPNVYEVYSDGE